MPLERLSTTDQAWARRQAAAAAKATASTNPAAPTADWPGFRGLNRDGKSPDKGLLKEWPEGGPRLLWKATDIGKGYSSVAVAGGTVYITGDYDDQLMLHAYDLDGQLKWKAAGGAGLQTRLPRLPRHADDRRQEHLPAVGRRTDRLLRRRQRTAPLGQIGQGFRRRLRRLGLRRIGADRRQPGRVQARRQQLHRGAEQAERRCRSGPARAFPPGRSTAPASPSCTRASR